MQLFLNKNIHLMILGSFKFLKELILVVPH